jgi:hypothetical protein
MLRRTREYSLGRRKEYSFRLQEGRKQERWGAMHTAVQVGTVAERCRRPAVWRAFGGVGVV